VNLQGPTGGRQEEAVKGSGTDLQFASGAGEMLELPILRTPPTKQFLTELMEELPVISTASTLLELTWRTQFGAVMVMLAFPVNCRACWAVGLRLGRNKSPPPVPPWRSRLRPH